MHFWGTIHMRAKLVVENMEIARFYEQMCLNITWEAGYCFINFLCMIKWAKPILCFTVSTLFFYLLFFMFQDWGLSRIASTHQVFARKCQHISAAIKCQDIVKPTSNHWMLFDFRTWNAFFVWQSVTYRLSSSWCNKNKALKIVLSFL